MEDREIIALFQARSQEAVSALNDKYGPLCCRVVGHILESREDTEECLNDTWLAVWNAIPPQEPDPLSAWVCRLARNQALKRYRYNTAARRDSRGDAPLEELEGCLPAAGSVEDALTEQELTRLLDRFLYSLSRKDRTLFVRRYWYADPVKDIAEACHMTPNHVSVRLARLRAMLRRELEQEEIFP
ncbi:MAG: sigma-70 family RNA polymerase sigma factor [Clostridiales bacterium]|nr:sigma-70 family RNA polymerase sigma factor [Clostridiales bacterium]